MNTYLFVLCLAIGHSIAQGPPTEAPPKEPECGYGCMNGAKCEWPGYGEEYHCMCPEGYTGMFCETEIPNCNNGDMCYNSGECKLLEGTENEYYCECRHPYTGYQCETEMKDCSTGEEDSMCHNGGWCDGEEGGDHWCHCEHPWTGMQCETKLPMCETCHPMAEPCEDAPCDCQGECPVMTPCVSCMGPYSSDCGAPSEERMEGVTVEHCERGCVTKNWMNEGRWYVMRGCAEEMCWTGCNEGKECTQCCMGGEYCNGAPVHADEAPISSASAITSSVAVIFSIAVFGFLTRL